MPPNISLCMICRDEEDTIWRCLKAVRDFVDEVVVVDTGSRDRTKERAAKFADRLFDFEWRDDFSAARNFAISKAHGDWLLFLDADEVIYVDELRRLGLLLAGRDRGSTEGFTGVLLDQHQFEVDYRRLRFNDYIPWPEIEVKVLAKLILVKNTGDLRYVGRIHESLDFATRVNADIRPGIRCAHFKNRHRLPAKHAYYFELEERAVRAEPTNSNAHLNALRTYLLRGRRGDFVAALGQLSFVESRFLRAFRELRDDVEAAGWPEASRCIDRLLDSLAQRSH
jgi:glycosyltransferase involved in cell wall biosynthesis